MPDPIRKRSGYGQLMSYGHYNQCAATHSAGIERPCKPRLLKLIWEVFALLGVGAECMTISGISPFQFVCEICTYMHA